MRRFAALAAALLAATAAFAGDFWDATWVGGWDQNNGVQLIVAGDEAIGLLWREDYVADLTSAMAADGKTLTLHWAAGEATVAWLADDKVSIAVRETGKPEVTVALERE